MPASPRTRRSLLAVSALVAAVGVLTACGSGSEAASAPAVQQSVSPAVTLVSASAAEPLIVAGVPVLDVRRPDEFAAGHLPGALNIDLESADFTQQVSALDPTTAWVVYCRSGNRSAVAAAQMETLGFPTLYDLAGGIIEWEQAGLPVTTA